MIVLLLVFANSKAVLSQTSKQEIDESPEKSAGVYYAYPEKEIIPYTPIPDGYEPFYISHLGRHGSRYLIDDDDYKRILDLFEDANKSAALTNLGTDVYKRLQAIWKIVQWHGGDLSPVGLKEQRGIAERMYASFPEIFTKNSEINASSTTVVRCVLSMDTFSERLKEMNPALNITREASMEHQRYLNHHTEEAIAFRSAPYTWKEEYNKFEESHVNPSRLINSLFSDSAYITKRVNLKSTMLDLFNITGNMQNIETELSFYDLFTNEELFDLWQCKNYKSYVNDANCALNKGIMFENCKPLLKNIIDTAEKIIKNGGKGATLRFAHDGNIIPLAMLLHLKDCYNSVSESQNFYSAWSDFKVAPMGGNIQIIFFRNKNNSKDDILVKFLMHEKETLVPPIKTNLAPYYKWSDVKEYYNLLLDN